MAGNKNASQNLTDEARSKGGSMSGGNFANDPQRASEAGSKGGQSQQNTHNNPGNFANDTQRASDAGQKGGQSSNQQDDISDISDDSEGMPS